MVLAEFIDKKGYEHCGYFLANREEYANVIRKQGDININEIRRTI